MFYCSREKLTRGAPPFVVVVVVVGFGIVEVLVDVMVLAEDIEVGSDVLGIEVVTTGKH